MNKNKAAKVLGSIRSERKSNSSRINGKNNVKPNFEKVEYFKSVYPFKLLCNKWKEKFPVGKTKTGRVATYNPDFFCKTTNHFIEVATSKPNISEQKLKWYTAIKNGVKLKVYWWDGSEITDQIKQG